MTNMKEKAKEVLHTYQKIDGDFFEFQSDGKCLSVTIREAVKQLQQSPGVIMCADVVELCAELEKL
jgi:hypothetical protein